MNSSQTLSQAFAQSNCIYEDILKDKVIFPLKNNKEINQRAVLIRPEGCEKLIYGLSFSSIQGSIQIALLGKVPENSDIFHAKIIYDENCGYDHFGSPCFEEGDFEGVVNEIVRIWNYLSSPLLKVSQSDEEESLHEEEEIEIK
jgi:hypothetical protein